MEFCRPHPQETPKKESLRYSLEQACIWSEKKKRNSAELETVRASKSPTTVVTANGEVQTEEEATVYVRELDLFVTVMLLEDTPAVLSLGKLCEDHGFKLALDQWSRTTSHQKWQENRLQHSELRTLRCPWSVDKFFNFIFTYFSYIFIAGNGDSHGASSSNKKCEYE